MTSADPMTGVELVDMLGDWRRGGARHGAADLAAAVERRVLDGRMPAGTRLPAERELADALGVSRALVGAALDKLREDGLVASRRGAGSWVTAPRGPRIDPDPLRGAGLIDLAQASPPAVPGLLKAVDAARLTFGGELVDHGYRMRGVPALRERIAERYTARGLPTNPEQVLVTGGAQYAFALALRGLTGPGDRVLVDEPCYPNTPEAIRAAGAVPVGVPVDPANGWDLAAIDAALRQAAPRLACFVVDFHNPTGLRLPTPERERLGGMLARARTPFVVDETQVELDLEGDPLDGPPPLAVFGGAGAITVGSASKSHWGGLRLGWIRASEEMVERLVAARASLDLGSPVLEQLVLAELLADDDVLPGRRAELRVQRDALAACVAEHCPGWTFRLPGGGLALWCELPGPISTRLSAAAVNHGVRVVAGPAFGVGGGLDQWLRLPYTQPVDRLTDAVRRLSLAAAAIRPATDADAPVT